MPLWVFFFVILALSGGSYSSLPPSLPFRMRRYADAIFTNSYRKVLGQLSARKLLQDIMSRQQGEKNQEQEAKVRLGRQVDSMWSDQKQTALENILVALLQKHRPPSAGMAPKITHFEKAGFAVLQLVLHRGQEETWRPLCPSSSSAVTNT